MLTTGYDKKISLLKPDGEILISRKIDIVPAIYSLGFFFKGKSENLADITSIFIGSAIKKSIIVVLDRELNPLGEYVLDPEGNDRITFLRTFNIGSLNLLTAGSLKKFFVGYGKESIEVSFNLPLKDIPIDSDIVFQKDVIKIAIASTVNNIIRLFELNLKENTLKLKTEIKERNRPIQIRIWEKNIIVVTEKGIFVHDFSGSLISSMGLDNRFGWKNMDLVDIDNDSFPEILIGSQWGDYELAKDAFSDLLVYKINGKRILKKNYKGWIKFVHSPWSNRIILSAGKTLNFYQILDDFSLVELSVQKFDKPSISYDLKVDEENNYLWISLGLLDGEVGIGLLEKNGKELSLPI